MPKIPGKRMRRMPPPQREPELWERDPKAFEELIAANRMRDEFFRAERERIAFEARVRERIQRNRRKQAQR